MKRIISLCLFVVCAMCASAQYFNPYMNPNAYQQAYELGKRMVQERAEQQKKMDAQSVNACIGRISQAIAHENFTEAEEWAENLSNLDEGKGYFYLGLTNELQGYGDYAKNYYELGAQCNNKSCKLELDRITTQGFATDEQIEAVVNYYKRLEVVTHNMASQITNEIWSDTDDSPSYYENSPNRSRATQKANCSMCNGTGYRTTSSRYSASADSHHNQAGNACMYCGATTDHYHYRCPH